MQPSRVPYASNLEAVNLKNVSDRHLIGARRYKMRSAERRQEIVQRDLIRQVRNREARGDVVRGFRTKQIVRSDSEVEQIARLNTVGIVIVVFFACLRQRDQR